jgi:hypothetical protein
MSKKRMLADVLWRAAFELHPAVDAATCCLAYRAEFGESWGHHHNQWASAARASKAVAFLRELGCAVGSTKVFDRYERGEERQGVRYMWLLLAMHVAEDERIEL